MDRLTEYHNGVPVIKGKRFKEAAGKLAWYEDIEDQNGFAGKMKITIKPGLIDRIKFIICKDFTISADVSLNDLYRKKGGGSDE